MAAPKKRNRPSGARQFAPPINPPSLSTIGAGSFSANDFFKTILPVFLILFLTVFAAALLPGTQFCFRDVGDFYYPLLRSIHEQWRSGLVPLWNPYENLGQPLAGNPTSAVFYPLQLIFFLPFSFGVCFKIYILIHLPIAFAGLFLLARHWNRSVKASVFAAATYTFCAPVFSQYSNPIFLIGAAWLPWGIWAGSVLLRNAPVSFDFFRFIFFRRTAEKNTESDNQSGNEAIKAARPRSNSRRAIALLAVILALTVFGGDPQTAYVMGLLLVLLLWFQRRGASANGGSPSPLDSNYPVVLDGSASISEIHGAVNEKIRRPNRFLGGILSWARRLCSGRLAALMTAAALAVLLGAIVILPSAEFTVHSDRTLTTHPTSVWDIPAYLSGRLIDARMTVNDSKSPGRVVAEGLFCLNFKETGHRTQIYEFSVPPWRMAELIWPNRGATPLSNRDVKTMIPNDTFWSVGYYAGIIALVLAGSVFCLRRRDSDSDTPVIRWASWTFLLAIAASLGGFGPLWFLRLIASLATGEPFDPRFADADPVGGVFWLMNVLLPAFDSFRYSAKLMTAAVLALSILAAFGFDRLGANRKAARLALILLIVSLSGAALFALLGDGWLERLGAGKRTNYGPFDPQGARLALIGSMAQTALILSIFLLIWRYGVKKASSGVSARCASALLALAVIDLALAGYGKVPVLPESVYSAPSSMADRIRADADSDSANGDTGEPVFPRCYIHPTPWIPDVFRNIPSENREAEFSLWKQQALLPKYSYRHRIGAAPVFGTFVPRETFFLLNWVTFLRSEPGAPIDEVAPFLAWLDLDYAITPKEYRQRIPGMTFLDGYAESPPRAPINEREKEENIARLVDEEWPFDTALWKNPIPSRRVRIVRTPQESSDDGRATQDSPDDGRAAASASPYCFPAGNARDGESVRLTEYRPDRIAFEATLLEPGNVVLAEQFWPGWRATRRNLDHSEEKPTRIEIEPAENILRRVELPAGRWRVEMTYRPNSLKYGALLTALGLLLTALFFLAGVRGAAAPGGRVSD